MIVSSPLAVGTIVTATGAQLTVDPNALITALASSGVSVFDDLLADGRYSYTTTIGVPLFAAPGGSTTCTQSDPTCEIIDMIEGELTTTP